MKLSSLTKLEEFLLAGERRQAYHYALDEKLWGHAMLIARSLDQEAWNEVVQEFIKSELGNAQISTSTNTTPLKKASGLEGLKVAYGLFGGFGASSSWFFVSVGGLGCLTCHDSTADFSISTSRRSHKA